MTALPTDKEDAGKGQMPAGNAKHEGAGDRVRSVVAAATAVWALGMAVLWIYSMVSAFRLKRQLIGAVPDEKSGAGRIYLCDYIHTAFVVGVLRPRIYLPTALTETERSYILLHEKTHIKRGGSYLSAAGVSSTVAALV